MGPKGRFVLNCLANRLRIIQSDSPACLDLPTGAGSKNEGMIEILRRYYYFRSSNFEPQANILEM